MATASELNITQASTQATVPALCLAAIKRHAKPDALNEKRGGQWLHTNAESFVERVRAVALGLVELGIEAGDRIALLSENRPEWSIVDLAILCVGAVNVPIYTTQAVEQVRFILEDSGARLLFVSGRKVFKHARAAIETVERIEKTVFFDADALAATADATDAQRDLMPASIDFSGGERSKFFGKFKYANRTITLDALEEKGRAQHLLDEDLFERLMNNVRAEDLATIIYTSGTTGEPKGVMLSHENFVSNVLAIAGTLPISSTDKALSVLPLSHIFERTVFYVFCCAGVSVYYAASFDQVGEHLREVQPTIMTAVPRLFEKVYHRIVKQGTGAGGARRKLFLWALKTGTRYAELNDKGEAVPPLLDIQQTIASKLVFSKWRAGVGGHLRYFVSGGAPLSPALSYAFLAAGIPILQGYGLTETCVVSANRPDDNAVGSVGLPFPGIEIMFEPDGEILVRGQNVMRGYYNQPEATAAVMRGDWFATGDVGRMDERGRLYITDRKKDLFKLSNGKYIAPQLVESLIKQSALVSQVVVVGAGRKQPVALIVPEWEALAAAMNKAVGSVPQTRREQSLDPQATKIVQREVAQLTSELADYERIRRIALLDEEFSIDGGELTPTLKVKRRVVDEKYGALIDELYGGTGAKED